MMTFSDARDSMAKQVKPHDLVYSDAANLKSLNELLQRLEQSSTYLLLLTKQVLERPWILTELCTAHALGRTVILIRLAGLKGDDQKNFKFPDDLESVINDWKEFHQLLHHRSKHADQDIYLRQTTRGMERFIRIWQKGTAGAWTGTFRLHFQLERIGHAVRAWLYNVATACCTPPKRRDRDEEPPEQTQPFRPGSRPSSRPGSAREDTLGPPQNIPPPRSMQRATPRTTPRSAESPGLHRDPSSVTPQQIRSTPRGSGASVQSDSSEHGRSHSRRTRGVGRPAPEQHRDRHLNSSLRDEEWSTDHASYMV
jgi:hypothetical protein